jgi:hypothetical protein
MTTRMMGFALGAYCRLTLLTRPSSLRTRIDLLSEPGRRTRLVPA